MYKILSTWFMDDPLRCLSSRVDLTLQLGSIKRLRSLHLSKILFELFFVSLGSSQKDTACFLTDSSASHSHKRCGDDR